MIRLNLHETLAEAYLEGLRDLLEHGQHVPSVTDPTSVASNFGKGDRPSIELLNYSFEVKNPYTALLFSRARRVRVPYCIGLFLWSIAGSDSLDWISYYNPIAVQFSDDGYRLCGAFGKRLFDYNGNINQIESICTRIERDPASRRGLGVISTPEDNLSTSKEYPCAIAVQYFLRDKRLQAITYMRAQQALTVLPFDAFLFMSLQCFLASRLGVEVGSYIHVAGTFHIYENEVEQAKQVISAGVLPVHIGDFSDDITIMDALLTLEENIRRATQQKDIKRLNNLSSSKHFRSSSFFENVRVILLIHSWLTLQMHDKVGPLLAALERPMSDLLQHHIESDL